MVKIDPAVFLIQVITFLVAVPLVWNTLIKALSNTLKKRDEFIRDSIDRIEKDKAEIEAIKNDYAKKAEELERLSSEERARAAAEGEKLRERLSAEAKAEGARLIKEAKAEIEVEKARAIAEVKDVIVDLSIAAAGKIIKKKLTKKESGEVVKKYLKDIEKRVN